MTFRHRAGVSPYTSAYAFAETCVFDKQSPGPFHCDLHCCRHPLFRSYGVNMPSSLTTLLPKALGFSPHLPVSVCGTGAQLHTYTFSRRLFSLLPYYNFSPFRPSLPAPGTESTFVSVYLSLYGNGISTVCASTTPFVRVRTYLTRNFATLGPL